MVVMKPATQYASQSEPSLSMCGAHPIPPTADVGSDGFDSPRLLRSQPVNVLSANRPSPSLE